MNQKQRDFLVDTIQKKANEQISDLEKQQRNLKKPLMKNYILRDLKNGTAKLRTEKEIFFSVQKEQLYARAYGRYDVDDDMENEKWLAVIFEQPNDYTKQFVEYQLKNKELLENIESLKSKRDTLVMRVKLAPDKRLEVLVSEIDDMGDISMMDSRLLLLGKQENKLLE